MNRNVSELLKEIEELKIALVKALARIEVLEKENAELRARLAMNSSNSSFPPSSDKFVKKKDKNRSLRVKSSKTSGGQIGHKGATLEKAKNPDFIIELLNDVCSHCSHDLKDVQIDEIKSRQVFDIPKIKINVTEYRAHSKTCPHCNKKTTSKFPKNVTHNTQYGSNIKGLILNLNIYQSLPYKRLQELLDDVFNLKLSQGTIYNTLKTAYSSLESVENFFKDELSNASVAHADETGTKLNGSNRWIHSFSNENYTVLTSHKNRGKKAIIDAGILPNFHGILVHDCWYAYDTFNHIRHGLCCAHFLRELQGIQDNTSLEFPQKIKDTLLKLKSFVENDKIIDEKMEVSLSLEYILAVERGFLEEAHHYPFDPTVGGRPKRSKAYNLLKRLQRYEDVLTFFTERNASLFTNNAAEREIRNVKLKSKVQGAFRSELGADIFCRIRSYIATMKKNGYNQYTALKSVFELCDTMLPIVK